MPADGAWSRIRCAILLLLRNEQLESGHYIAGYDCVYELCIADDGALCSSLYRSLKLLLSNYCHGVNSQLHSTNVGQFPQMYIEQFDKFFRGLIVVDKMFSHLNKTYVLSAHRRFGSLNTRTTSNQNGGGGTKLIVKHLGTIIWRQKVYEPCSKILVEHLMSVFRDIRQDKLTRRGGGGEEVDLQHVVDLINTFHRLELNFNRERVVDDNSDNSSENHLGSSLSSVYLLDFESVYLKQSVYFFREQSNLLFSKFPVEQCLLHIIEMIQHERHNVSALVACRATSEKTVELALKFLFYDNFDSFLECFGRMFRDKCCSLLFDQRSQQHSKFFKSEDDENDENDENRIWERFFEGFGKLMEQLQEFEFDSPIAPVVSIFDILVEETAMKALSERTRLSGKRRDIAILVDLLLRLHSFYSYVVDFHLSCLPVLRSTWQTAFGRVLASIDHFPHVLATAFDIKMRSDESDDLIECYLERLLELVKYLLNKDEFCHFYTHLLASRLISLKVLSVQRSLALETAIVVRLTSVLGHVATQRLNRMIGDINSSYDLKSRFRENVQSCDRRIRSGFHCLVLAQCVWPTESSLLSHNHLPPQLSPLVSDFSRFYQLKFRSHRLQWVPEMWTVHLMMMLQSNTSFEIVVDGVLASSCLCFNSSNSLRRNDIAQLTGFPSANIASSLDSLLQVGIIECERKTSEENVYTLNMKYKQSKKRVSFQSLSANRKKQQQLIASDLRVVNEERRLQIKSAIVRIMKSKSPIRHVNLLEEVVAQISNRFLPSPAQMKSCISALIDQNYIRRTEFSHEYEYVA